jgi:hypothetical protein
MALTKDRDTKRRDGVGFTLPAAAGVRIYAGSIVGINADGQAIPAGTAGTVAVLGIAQQHVDNRDGQAGDQPVPIWRGTFAVKAGQANLTNAAYGKPVKAVDDESVALADAGAIVAGIVRAVDADGVWVEF